MKSKRLSVEIAKTVEWCLSRSVRIYLDTDDARNRWNEWIGVRTSMTDPTNVIEYYSSEIGARIFVTDLDICICSAWKFSAKEFRSIYDFLLEAFPQNKVLLNRSYFSLAAEWACHKFLYKLHICRERTADVDLNYPQETWEKILYPICGVLVWIFIWF